MNEIVPVQIKTTKELPEYFMMFVDDMKYAMSWLEKHDDGLARLGVRLMRPLMCHRYTSGEYSVLAFTLLPVEAVE